MQPVVLCTNKSSTNPHYQRMIEKDELQKLINAGIE